MQANATQALLGFFALARPFGEHFEVSLNTLPVLFRYASTTSPRQFFGRLSAKFSPVLAFPAIDRSQFKLGLGAGRGGCSIGFTTAFIQ